MKTITKSFACPLVLANVSIVRQYELASGIGDDQPIPVLLAEACQRERTCPHLGDCPIRK
jgi:hypothetical protein